MTNYTTRVEQNFSQTHVALAQAVAVERESLGLEPAPGLRGGLGWQKEDTHLLALHEPVRHELPRSDPASLVGHVDSLAMLLPLSSLKVLAALRSSTRSLPRSQLACWGKLPELFFGFLPNASTRDFYSSTPTTEPTSISAAALEISGAGNLEIAFGNVLLEISFGKDPEIFVPVLVSRQNQCTPSRAPRRETYSRGSPIWSFSRARKTPSFGGKKLSTQNQVYTPPAVGAPETERQRE